MYLDTLSDDLGGGEGDHAAPTSRFGCAPITTAAICSAAVVISDHRLPTSLVWTEHYEDGTKGTLEARTPSTW
jgi:hypothetical protein